MSSKEDMQIKLLLPPYETTYAVYKNRSKNMFSLWLSRFSLMYRGEYIVSFLTY